MSADNGIYILETKGPEYRVAELMAIDNLWWDCELNQTTSDKNVIIKNAREMFANSTVFTDEDKAVIFAWDKSKNYYFLEYGISSIKVDCKF